MTIVCGFTKNKQKHPYLKQFPKTDKQIKNMFFPCAVSKSIVFLRHDSQKEKKQRGFPHSRYKTQRLGYLSHYDRTETGTRKARSRQGKNSVHEGTHQGKDARKLNKPRFVNFGSFLAFIFPLSQGLKLPFNIRIFLISFFPSAVFSTKTRH